MPATTTNLLSAVNKVLENIGERQVTTLSTPLGKLVYDCIVDSCTEASLFAQWTFLKQIIPAQSWLNEVAYLGDEVQSIHEVLQGDDNVGYIPLYFMDSRSFLSRGLIPTTDATLYNARYYMLLDYNKVRINPYPTGSTGQSQIKFNVTTSIIAPKVTTDLFPFPERFLPIVIAKATSLALLRHLGDAQSSDIENRRFVNLATVMSSRERGTIPGRQTMYRRFR